MKGVEDAQLDLFVTRPNYKMLLCPDMTFLGSLHLKQFCELMMKCNIFLFFSCIHCFRSTPHLHLSAPDKPKSWPPD